MNQKVKRGIVWTMVLCLMVGMLSVTALATENPFTDVKDTDWFFNPVMWAKDNGITSGLTATTFGPESKCTRAQVVTFLWAANGRPDPQTTVNPFTDVADDAWYVKPVLWAVEQGITGGTSATTFSPEKPCNRAEIVTFLYAANGKPAVSGESTFGDVANSAWYLKPVLWAAQNDITGGIGDGKFGPENPCTRNQVVTFLYKVYGNTEIPEVKPTPTPTPEVKPGQNQTPFG